MLDPPAQSTHAMPFTLTAHLHLTQVPITLDMNPLAASSMDAVAVVLGGLALAAWLVLKLLGALWRLACGRKKKGAAAGQGKAKAE